MGEMKYEVGDKVLIKSKEWWDAQPKTLSGSVQCGSENFTPRMTAFCGQIVMIKEIMIDAYLVEGNCYYWNDEMFEGYTFESKSRKDDRKDNKEMWELLPFETIEEAVKVFTFDAKKYGINTWQNLPNGFERYRAAFLRHMVAHLKGEVLDRESGLLHLSHCLWNSIAMLHVYMRDHKDTIDFADIHIKASEAYFKKQKDNIAKGDIDKLLDAHSEVQAKKAEQQRTWK